MTSPNPVPVPGGARLILAEEATDASTFVLQPTPSSDPNEPLNWSAWRKCFNFGLCIAVTVAAFTNVSIQTVFWQQMTVDMGVSISQLTNAQSAQLAGLALGCLFFIPLTIKYGRRSTYVTSTAALAAVAWWTSRMTTYGGLIATAILTGLAGAINETAVQMTTLSICLTILFVVFLVALEETKYIPVSVGETEGVEISSDHINSKEYLDDKRMDDITAIATQTESTIPISSWRQRLRFVTKTNESLPQLFIMPLYVITLPHDMFTALQFASGVSWLVIFMQTISIVFSAPPYLFTTAGVGYMALGPFVGNIFGSLYGGPFADWLIVRLARRNGGYFEPEMRLYPLVLTTITMAGGIIMFGVTAARGMHWIYPSIGGAFFAFGLGANGDMTFTLVIDCYRELTAETFIGIAFMRNAISVAIPFAIVPWMNTMGLSNMFIMCGMFAFAIGSLFVPMIIWGKKIRTTLAPKYWKLVEMRSKIG
ncbi:hypothetical protein ACHAPU_009945 [Fusarium lateritium]